MDDQCTYIVRTYQGLASFSNRCENRAKSEGLCGTHLRSEGKIKTEKMVRVPLAGPTTEVVKRTTKIYLEWEAGQGPIFPRSTYDAKSVCWRRLSVEVEGEVNFDTRLNGSGAFVKDNGEPSKTHTELSYTKISSLPDEVREAVLSLFRSAS